MFGYGGSCVFTGAVTITLIGSPDGALPPFAAPAVVAAPAAVVALAPAAVVALAPAAVVAVAPAAVVALAPAVVAAAVSADLESEPHAARNRASAAAVAATARGTAPRPRIFDELVMDSPQVSSGASSAWRPRGRLSSRKGCLALRSARHVVGGRASLQ